MTQGEGDSLKFALPAWGQNHDLWRRHCRGGKKALHERLALKRAFLLISREWLWCPPESAEGACLSVQATALDNNTVARSMPGSWMCKSCNYLKEKNNARECPVTSLLQNRTVTVVKMGDAAKRFFFVEWFKAKCPLLAHLLGLILALTFPPFLFPSIVSESPWARLQTWPLTYSNNRVTELITYYIVNTHTKTALKKWQKKRQTELKNVSSENIHISVQFKTPIYK